MSYERLRTTHVPKPRTAGLSGEKLKYEKEIWYDSLAHRQFISRWRTTDSTDGGTPPPGAGTGGHSTIGVPPLVVGIARTLVYADMCVRAIVMMLQVPRNLLEPKRDGV